MEKYKLIDVIGHGSYGVVYKALNLEDGEVVALKKLYRKHYSMEDCLNMIEIKSLIALNGHPNIVKLKDVINQEGVVFLEFEYMECSLHDLIVKQTKPFSESEIRNMCFQILQGLAYIHHKGYIHRDLKPANLLVSKNAIKIADFGLTRPNDGQPPFSHRVTTRAYRAPEVFLHSPVYDSAVDMWAMGAIMAEMFILKPLFLGSSETNVMYNICEVLGQFSALLPNASPDAINLIASLLSWDPLMRPTAMDALHHPFFDRCYVVTPSLIRKPMLFELELLKMEKCLKRIGDSNKDYEIDDVIFEGTNELELVRLLPKHLLDSEIDEVGFEGSNEELIRMLPEHLYDFDIDEVQFEDSNEELVRLLPGHLFDFETDETSLYSCTTDFEGTHDPEEDSMYESAHSKDVRTSLYSCTTDFEVMQDPEEDSVYKFANTEEVRVNEKVESWLQFSTDTSSCYTNNTWFSASY